MEDPEKGPLDNPQLDVPKDDLEPGSPTSLGSEIQDPIEPVNQEKTDESNKQSVIVDWDGPDDPEFPQNL